jgi:hypothetical protein
MAIGYVMYHLNQNYIPLPATTSDFRMDVPGNAKKKIVTIRIGDVST